MTFRARALPEAQRRAVQRASHGDLLREIPVADAGRATRPPVDAIIVPAHRSAERLYEIAALATVSGTRLVVLASHACHLGEVEKVVASVPGCRALIADVPESFSHPLLQFQTSSARFADLSPGRHSDLSVKRNLGLLLARLSGWRKIMFLDDDMFGIQTRHLALLSAQLERSPIAGMVARAFPDNSVVCHASRLSGNPQGNFITGGALGVHTGDLPLDFFPDIYNEDWFFFAQRAAVGGVAMVGTAQQEEFNPFGRPGRATQEEFGDVLAEGLFARIGRSTGVAAPDPGYWRLFMDSRAELIDRISAALERMPSVECILARESLRHAQKQLAVIQPSDCADFVAAWLEDRADFAFRSSRWSSIADHRGALDVLGLERWLSIDWTESSALYSLR